MKRLILQILFLYICLTAFSYTLHLKENAFIKGNAVMLFDIVEEDNLTNIPNIKILEAKSLPIKISNKEILSSLIENGIYDLTLAGTDVIINDNNETLADENANEELPISLNAIQLLEKTLESYIDSTNLKITIDVLKTEPNIDLQNIYSNFEWQIEKFNHGLKDLEKVNNYKIIIDGKKYFVSVNIKIYADLFFAKEGFLQNSIIKLDGFDRKSVDITAFKDIDNLVFNIKGFENAILSKNIGAGEVLRWTSAKRQSLVKEGENINLVLNKNGFEIILPCTVLKPGFENEKIKIRLLNGNEKFGKLCNYKGHSYVEIF